MPARFCHGCQIELEVEECPRCYGETSPAPKSKSKPRRRKTVSEIGKDFGLARPTGLEGAAKHVELLIARDPGESSGLCLLSPTRGVQIRRTFGKYTYLLPKVEHVGQTLPQRKINSTAIFVTEDQWLKGAAEKRRGILTLSKRSGIWLGYHVGLYRACHPLCQISGVVLPVDIWKSCICHGKQTDKYVHANRIEELLTSDERELLPRGPARLDCLSAIGIGWAAWLLGDLRKWIEI